LQDQLALLCASFAALTQLFCARNASSSDYWRSGAIASGADNG
jgi:hypothetical protein